MLKKTFLILRFVKGYSGYASLNILFNILSVLFSLFSITMAIPFLRLLFKSKEELITVVNNVPELKLSMDSIVDNFNAYIGQIILESNSKALALLFICLLVIVSFFLKNFFRYLAMYYLAPVRNGVVKDLRNTVFKKILELPLSYYSEERKGDIISRITSDVQEIEWAIMSSLEMVFREPISIIAFLGTMFVFSPQLTIFVFILLPISGLLIGRIGKSLKKSALEGQRKMGNLLSIIEETLSGLKIIQAFVAEKDVKAKFEKQNDSYKKTMIKMYRKRDLASPLSEFMGVAVLVILMWFGGNLVLGEKVSLSPEVFIGYIFVFSQILNPAKSLTTAYYNVQKGVASIERIEEILKAENSILKNTGTKEVKEFINDIEYRNVCFTYDDRTEVLNNINLLIPKGKTIALVGESGGGKSTLADLLPRFYDPTSGEILIDGTSIKEYKLDDLRNLLGVVTQQSILFNDSVSNNIAFGLKNITKEDIIRAAKIANAHDFISEMEYGYDTNIGDSGCKLSGGQRQRITIARAILKNPPILILDEATSALDTESERLVQDALIKLMQNRTSVVIAHRLSTIQNADEIIVVQKGKFVERGNHSELLAKDGFYKKLYDMQVFS